MKTITRVLAVAGVGTAMFALAARPALAFHGTLARCVPAAGTKSTVSLSPGLTCTNAKNSIKVAVGPKTGNAVDGCVGNGAAPWGTWNANKIQKILPADVAAIKLASVS